MGIGYPLVHVMSRKESAQSSHVHAWFPYNPINFATFRFWLMGPNDAHFERTPVQQ